MPSFFEKFCMIDVNFALAQAHANNLDRYRSMRVTHLSPSEIEYIEARISEEMAALTALQASPLEQPSPNPVTGRPVR